MLVIDNYDSFTYNLVHCLYQAGVERVRVFRRDALPANWLEKMQPRALVISPGPGHPAQAPETLAALRASLKKIPILGVCLGHQMIGHLLGGRVVRAASPVHGKTTPIFHDGRGIFAGLPQGVSVVRYHSLVIEPSSLPPALQVTAVTARGEIMGIRHRHYPVEGVQFHPESVLTEGGRQLIRNFVQTYLK
ncbi:aminodeoxychorismate/anthranilate synthase component II [Desulfurispora thermophila]|uniref:aminodeoxychorismate/anthranilate synthase component II n=1 Tax=Desulfurispora thermophila TaxID=265470 RepID=UPI0034A43236